PGAAAFVLYGALRRSTYPSWLLFGAGCSVLLAIVVSGSRSLVMSVLLVMLSLAIVLLIRPDAVNRFGKSLILLVIGMLIVSRLPIVQEGLTILSSRFTESAEASETTITSGLIQRTLSGFTDGLGQLGHAPIFGICFAVVFNGLCLASTRPGKIAPAPLTPTTPRLIRGRSAYADRLHGADASYRNGSVDR